MLFVHRLLRIGALALLRLRVRAPLLSTDHGNPIQNPPTVRSAGSTTRVPLRHRWPAGLLYHRQIWRQASVPREAKSQRAVLDASGIDYCDGAGTLCSCTCASGNGRPVDGLNQRFAPEFQRWWMRRTPMIRGVANCSRARTDYVEQIVKQFMTWFDTPPLVVFIGSSRGAGAGGTPPAPVRWQDTYKSPRPSG